MKGVLESQGPTLRIGPDRTSMRHATWLELFFDLVFVVAVAELAHGLGDDLSLSGLLHFSILFLPVWWSWVGATYYSNRFDSDSTLHRILTLGQMAAAAAMAVNVHSGLGATAPGFAISYTAFRLILVGQYGLSWLAIPRARPLTRRFGTGFAIGASFWLISVWVPSPWRFVLWGLGLAVDVGTPLFAGRLHAEHAPHAEHLTERFGLFTIVVLGETIVGVVSGTVGESWTPSVLAIGFTGLGVAFAVWWIYFDCLGGGAVERLDRHGDTARYQTWLYSHLPLQLCLAALGVSVEEMIRYATGGPAPPFVLWLAAGTFAGVYLSLTVMHWLGGQPTRWTRWMAGARLVGAVSPIAVVAVGGGVQVLAVTLLAVGAFGVLLDPLIPPFDWAPKRLSQRERTLTVSQERTDD